MAEVPLLALDQCTVRFGGLEAVSNLNLSVAPGELVGMIGPNGAGKTTAFNAITGVHPPTSGTVQFGGRALTGMAPYQIARLGIGRTFQNIRLFRGLTVMDNLLAAMHQDSDYGMLRAALRSRTWAATEARLEAAALELLGVFGLEGRAEVLAGGLPYGDQRRLEIARALATRPRLLLLDEPAAGLNPTETQRLMELVQQVMAQFELTILLIEHDMRMVMGICHRVVVLNYGREIAMGTPEELVRNPAVVEAYLGEPEP